jgi:CubicO group peptidase (beta-lactamase class C family)
MASLPRLMEVAKLPGVGVAVVQGDRLVWQHYAGVVDNLTMSRVGPETLFPAASLGKPLFAYAVLQLVGEGALDLDRPLRDYLTGDAPSGEREARVTARHVLGHSSGFPNWRQRPDEPYTSSFEPGTGFRYSGEGFYLLQRCVETLTGVGTEQFMQDRMTAIGMRSSTYLWRADASARLAHGHSAFWTDPGDSDYRRWEYPAQLFGAIERSGRPLATWRHEQVLEATRALGRTSLTPEYLRPNVASSLLTTVSDFAGFVVRLMAPRGDGFDLRPPVREEMLRPQSRVNSVQAWGLGVGLEWVPAGSSEEYLWQWGDNAGIWKNFVLAHPSSRSAIVVFSNGTYGMRVAERIVRNASGQDHPAFLWVG